MHKGGLLLFLLCLLTGCTSPSEETRRIRLIEQNAPAVVALNILRPNGGTFTATGFVLTPDGLIATTRHIVENTAYINATFSNGAVSAKAQPVAVSNRTDLALLRIPAKHLRTVQLVSSGQVRPGQHIIVIGNPRRLQNSVSTGIISQVRQKSDGTLLHQVTTPLSPSSSGSPVFDEKGRVISIVFGSYAGADNQNLNFSIPSDYLIDLVHTAGLKLPSEEDTRFSSNPFVRHVQKSWSILKRIFRRK